MFVTSAMTVELDAANMEQTIQEVKDFDLAELFNANECFFWVSVCMR